MNEMSQTNKKDKANKMNQMSGALVPPPHWTAYGPSTRYAAHCLGDGQGPCAAAARPARTPYAVDAWMAEHRDATGHARFTLVTSATTDLTETSDPAGSVDLIETSDPARHAETSDPATSAADTHPRGAGHGPRGTDWVPTLRAVAPALRLLAVVVLARADQGWSRVFDRALTRLSRQPATGNRQPVTGNRRPR
ncbi:hypothetical protein OYE22_18495 [Streptomyces sp. 71268]|uniref:hypothetical protein n=1 Tax=Streptomyces sp. 71268 TaxID=3002640 RepID=UPI0023F92960|nr:hypothetical protein [Streptomyces sp. 71268]WEV26969.1 hypothetical protein OYE22_18495 [Streptomyces sp. 71268]